MQINLFPKRRFGNRNKMQYNSIHSYSHFIWHEQKQLPTSDLNKGEFWISILVVPINDSGICR